MATDLASTTDHNQRVVREQSRLAVVLAVLLSGATAVLLIVSPPGWSALVLAGGVSFVVATWYRPVLGVASLLGLTLLFEQFDFASFRPATRLVPFFENASYVTGFKGFEASPLEILMVTVVVIVLIHALVRGRKVQENPLAVPVFVFAAALAMWLIYGLVLGGSAKVALWELRSLAYLCLLIFVVPQVLTSSRDVDVLLWVAGAMVGVKAAQGAWNYVVVLAGNVSDVRSITSHEDALFIAWVLVLLLALLVYKTLTPLRVVLLALSPLLLFTFVLTDRRAAFVALGIGLVVLAALIATDASKRTLLIKLGLPLLFVGVFVVLAGWNSPGVLGRPADIIQSIVAPDNQEDLDSSYYRRAEEVNLIHAIESSPILGLGFGRPFQYPGQGGIVDVGFSLENVIPHNEVMWIWAKMGTLGFSLFWVMIGSIIAFGGVVFRTAREPRTKVIAALVTCAVVMQVVVSYVDLQLTYARNMVFLGVLVAILARLPALEGGAVADARD